MRKFWEKQRQADEIQAELNGKGLSRRAFLDRLAVLGVGFGAASVLGAKDADAKAQPDTVASLKSTDPVLNGIFEEGRQDLRSLADRERDGPDAMTAQYYGGYGRYARGYARYYTRYYGRYARGYTRYYSRYARYGGY